MSTLSHKTVKLGPPRAVLPDYGALPRTKPASHWEAVAAGCRDYPDQWLAVQIDGMTVTSETPTERNAADWGALTMELAHGNAAYRGLRELLGEDGVDILEFALNPNYPLPARSIPVGDVEPQLVADLVAEQASLGLGMSYLDIAAGIVINKIRRATVKRRIQARAAGRLDLAEAVS